MKLPKHISFYLEHDSHKSNYMTAAEAVAEMSDNEWVSLEEMVNAINTDSIWRAQWYPDTPIGSYVLCASTLEALLAALERVDDALNGGN